MFISILIHVLVDVCIRMSSKYALYICIFMVHTYILSILVGTNLMLFLVVGIF
jgi:hypothetical protein